MSGSFSIGGLFSGYQSSELIDKLVAAQSGILRTLDRQKKGLESEQAAYQSVTGSAIGFQVLAHRMAQSSTFEVTKGSSSDATVVGVTASATAVAGTYSLKVNELAQAEQRMSQGFDDVTATTVGTGTITLGLGGASYGAITIDSTNNTLEGVAKAINNAELPVRAAIINDGGSSGNYHLVLTSTKTGADNTVSFTHTLSGGTAPTFSVLQAAKDAEVKIGDDATGITVKSASNDVENVIPGVKLSLLQKSTTAVKVRVNADTDSVADDIKSFIKAYNTTMDTIGSATAYDSDTKTAAPLQGDTTVNLLRSQLISITTGARSTSSSDALAALSDIGITLDGGGHLTISDSSAFNDAIETNLSGVKSLFSDSTTGLAVRLDSFLTTATEAQTGTLDMQKMLLDNQMEILEDSITQRTASLDAYRYNLELQFSSMETALSKLQTQSQFLTANLAASLAASTANK